MRILSVSKRRTLISYKDTTSSVQESLNTNCVLGIFITAYARLYLLAFIERTPGLCVLYLDTDTLIVSIIRGQPFYFRTGSNLGDMTFEHQDKEILEFIGSSPKAYALVLKDKKTGEETLAVKAKGITLTTPALNLLTRENLIKQAESLLPDNDRIPPILIPQQNIVRDAFSNLFTQNSNKKYSASEYPKRKFLAGGSSRPWGYVD
jgi:hypothetical protein